MGCPGEQTRGNRLQEKLTQATRVHDRDNQRRGVRNFEGFIIRYSSTRRNMYLQLLGSQSPRWNVRHRWSHGHARDATTTDMITLVVCKARCAFETARVARVLIGLVGKLTIQCLQPGPGDNIDA